MSYKRRKRFSNPNPNKRGAFSNPNRRGKFSYSNHGREGGYPNPNEYRMKVNIPYFSENLDIESFLDWIYELEKFFDMTYVFTEKQVNFAACKLKGGAAAWWDQLQITRKCQDKPSVMM